MQEIVLVISVMSVIAAVVTVADKICARCGAWRVPERVLWMLAICGGAVGMLAAMRVVRHKTKHRQFMVGLPLVIALQIVVISLCYFVKKISM